MTSLFTLRLLVSAALLALLPACSTPGDLSGAPGTRMVMSELYFGFAKPSGGSVTGREWERFLREEITPRFPDGLTLIDSAGQWRTRSGVVVREETKILRIVHPATPDRYALLRELRERYTELFGQEMVLGVVTPVRAAF